MTADVKTCVDSRVGFFAQYVTVPPHLTADVDAFIADVTALGESSVNSVEFEEKFVATGLNDRFNFLVSNCTPIPREMTVEEKAASHQITEEMGFDRKGIAKKVASDVVDVAAMELESEMISQGRKAMIAAGVMDEYTRTSNRIDIFNRFVGWLKRK